MTRERLPSYLLFFALIVTMMVTDLPMIKTNYPHLIPLFPDYSHIYTAKAIKLGFTEAFNQPYFPFTALLIDMLNLIGVKDELAAISILYISFKYIFAAIYIYVLYKLVERYINIKIKEGGAKSLISIMIIASFLYVLNKLVNDFVAFYFIPHSVAILLYILLIYSLLAPDSYNNVYKSFLIVLTYLLLNISYMVLYMTEIANSSHYLILTILITILIYKRVRSMNVILLSILNILHPLEASIIEGIIVATFILYSLLYRIQIVHSTKLFTLKLLALILVFEAFIIQNKLTISFVADYISNLYPTLAEIFGYNRYIVDVLNSNLTIIISAILLLIAILITSNKPEKVIERYAYMNKNVFALTFLVIHLVIVLGILLIFPTMYLYRLLHYLIPFLPMLIVLEISYLATVTRPLNKLYRVERAAIYVLWFLGMLLFSLPVNLDIIQASQHALFMLKNVMGYYGELSIAEIKAYEFIKNYINDNCKLIKTIDITYYRVYTNYYYSCLILSDPYTAYFLSRSLMLRAYFTPVYVIPNEYAQRDLKIFEQLKRDLVNLSLHNNIDNYINSREEINKVIIVISNRTIYWLDNANCIFVFLATSPHSFQQSNCVYNAENYKGETSYLILNYLDSSIVTKEKRMFEEKNNRSQKYYVAIYILDWNERFNSTKLIR